MTNCSLSRIRFNCVGYEVLTAMVLKSSIFWDITPCSPWKFKLRFGGTCRLHHHGWRISQVGNHHEAGSKECHGDLLLRNPGSLSTDYTAWYPRKQNFSFKWTRKRQKNGHSWKLHWYFGFWECAEICWLSDYEVPDDGLRFIILVNALHNYGPIKVFFFTGSTAPLGPGLCFSVSWSFYRRWDSLDEWSARRKASA
jgi:hypothetical protein